MINILDNKLINSVTRQQEAKVTLQEAWKEVQQKYHRSDSFTDDVSKEVTK